MQFSPLIAAAILASFVATSAANAQCPNGTPPPCDTRQVAPMTLIKRAAPRALDDRTYIVLPFHNVTRAPDIDWLSDAAVNMLSMDLSRWQDIKVIDDRRVADYMRDMKLGGSARLSMNDALAVATRAGAGRIVIGDVMKVGARTTVTATLVNARDGRQIRTAREETSVADSLIPLFGKLARQVLAVPAAGRAVGSIGTQSVEAYKSYVAGNQALNTFDAPAAKRHYQAALALDSNFALAHYKWAIAASYDTKAAAERQAQVKLSDINNIARVLEDPERIAHAKTAARLATPSLPARERALIAGLLATVSYDFPRACDAYRSLVRADSTDVEALYGYGLCLLGDDMVEPVVAGDTTKMRFRSSWNESLDIFRHAVSVDPTFHLAFDAIVTILTAPVRAGCARRDLIETCADTAIKRRYVAFVRRENDSLVTVPRAGFTQVVETIVESQRTSPVRENVELARRAAADWVALGPTESRAHKHLALLSLRVGRTADAERELIEVFKDPSTQVDMELYLRRLEVALKLMRGAEAIRLIDSMPIAMNFDLGRANAVVYAVATGRFRGVDSLYESLMTQQQAPRAAIAMVKQSNRIVAGVAPDTLGAMERVLRSQSPTPQTCPAACMRLLGGNYTLGLRYPREWPEFTAEYANNPYLAPGRALARKDTAALRVAARVLDSLSERRLALGRTEDASTIIAADAYLLLGDTVAALRLTRRLTDSTLQLSGIEASLPGTGGSTALLWPRAMLMRADLEAVKGDKVVARDYYTKFLALWAKSDPEFAPLMARVRASLAALR